MIALIPKRKDNSDACATVTCSLDMYLGPVIVREATNSFLAGSFSAVRSFCMYPVGPGILIQA